MLLFIILLLVFSIPAVQTSVANSIVTSINEKNNVAIFVDGVSLTYTGNVDLNTVLIRDHHNDTLIFAEEVETSILSLPGILNNTPFLGSTKVLGLQLDMKIYEGENRDNMAVFLNKLKSEKQNKTSRFRLTASDVNLTNSRFSFVNENAENPEILQFENLNLFAEDLEIDGPDVFVDIRTMAGIEESGLELSNLSTHFTYTPTQMIMDGLQVSTINSALEADIHFDYENGLSDFENEVQITANIKDASISSTDLQIFYEEFGAGQELNFSTNFEGYLNNFSLPNFRLRGMNGTILNANLVVQNLLNTNNGTFMIKGDLYNLSTNYYDLVNLLPGILYGKIPPELSRFGNVRIRGNAALTGNSLNADVFLFTQLGNVEADVTMGNFNNSEFATYHGNIVANEFNIGDLFKKESLGKTTFNLDVDGQGFTQESLDTEVNGSISALGYNNYIYNNIKIRGTLKAPVFNGNLLSLDPNLQLEFNGLADFSEDFNIYDFSASVQHADLATLNFIERDSISVFQGDIYMNMMGTTLNNVAGEIMLQNTSYRNENDTYKFDDLEITSSFEGPVRTININSPDVINGSVEGEFDITEVNALVENALGSLYTNYRPNNLTTNQYLEFNFDIYNKIVELFFPEITLAPNTFIRGRIESDESDFRLTFQSPEINAFDNMLQNVNIQVDNTNPLFNTYVEVDSVATDYYKLSEFNLINVTLNDTLFVRSEFRGGSENDDIFNLNLYHTINEENNSVVGVQKSNIKFKESVWFLNESNNNSNKLIFDDGFQNIKIDSLMLSHEDEAITLRGQIRDSTYKNIELQFDQVDLGKITPEISNLKMGGLVNGQLNLRQEHGAYYPNSSLTIEDLEVNEQIMGDLLLDIMGTEDLSYYNINTTLKNENVEHFSAIGEIIVDEESPIINMNVDLDSFDVSPLSPIGGETISNMRGLISGNANVSGNYKNPDIDGSLVLEDAGLTIPYLNVDVNLEENAVVALEEQQFNFEEITLTDTKYETSGILNGVISHQNFSDWALDLNISTDRLLVLDTEKDDNALYYGTAFISGNASLHGPTEELVIDVLATTQSGTVFNIPINESISIGDNSFINFLSPEEKEARLAGEEVIFEEAKGLELNFDLDITRDALMEIEIDESILRGRGAGTLLMEINTLGKFNMWGDFIVNQGEYIFKYSALQKRFEVLPGGSINWSGDPAGADINISAVYEANANPSIILENPSVSRRIPVDVIINLEGELIQPSFTFDLEYPNITSAVRSELVYKIENNANTEVQAFSLITLGQFYTPNVLAGGSGMAVAGNLFESASGFFNNLLSDGSGVFQVGLNYEQGARTPLQTTADRFGVTLSTQISERVLINGKVGVPIGGVTETVVVGNLEIDFLLNEEGTLRATIFNRENDIQYLGEELGFTQGIGLSYRVDFETFRELINKILKEEIIRSKEENEREELPTIEIPEYIRFPGEGEYLDVPLEV